MILLIDNYDSFVYNVYQQLCGQGLEITVIKNDEKTVEELLQMDIEALILSPGPGTPKENGILIEAIQAFQNKCPIFGICLGMQAIGEAFGGDVVQAKHIKHGKISKLRHSGQKIFSGIEQDIEIMRYHSLVLEPETLPSCFSVEGRDENGEIMAISHNEKPIFGLQFHPESIASQCGEAMIQNLIHIMRREGNAEHIY